MSENSERVNRLLKSLWGARDVPRSGWWVLDSDGRNEVFWSDLLLEGVLEYARGDESILRYALTGGKIAREHWKGLTRRFLFPTPEELREYAERAQEHGSVLDFRVLGREYLRFCKQLEETERDLAEAHRKLNQLQELLEKEIRGSTREEAQNELLRRFSAVLKQNT